MAKKKFDYNEMGESKLPVARAREMLKLKRATINDFDVIKNRSYEYLTYCDENNRVPTLRGIAERPNHETTIFLSQMLNLMADNLEQGALQGTMDRNASVFLLKSNFGYRDNKDVKVHHMVSESKSIEQIEKEISAVVIDADFEEK